MDEINEELELPNKLTLHFDGGCLINPGGPASIGWIIRCSYTKNKMAIRAKVICFGNNSTTTCNVAEWASLLSALEWLEEKDWKGELHIFGDSQLVIFQLIGMWRCKKQHLRVYLKKCLKLLRGIKFKAKWIPREQNTECDELASSVL